MEEIVKEERNGNGGREKGTKSNGGDNAGEREKVRNKEMKGGTIEEREE